MKYTRDRHGKNALAYIGLTRHEISALNELTDWVVTKTYTNRSVLFSDSRLGPVALVRQALMCLSRLYLDLKTIQIGEYFERDHGTVIHACKCLDRKPILAELVDKFSPKAVEIRLKLNEAEKTGIYKAPSEVRLTQEETQQWLEQKKQSQTYSQVLKQLGKAAQDLLSSEKHRDGKNG